MDRAEDHFELRYGDARGDAGWDDWLPVALVGRPVRRRFAVEFLPDSDGHPLHADIIAKVRRELDFLLLEVGGEDPWRYAQYHCGTQSNAYSVIHWSFLPKGASLA